MFLVRSLNGNHQVLERVMDFISIVLYLAQMLLKGSQLYCVRYNTPSTWLHIFWGHLDMSYMQLMPPEF